MILTLIYEESPEAPKVVALEGVHDQIPLYQGVPASPSRHVSTWYSVSIVVSVNQTPV